jgi:hypothetical protein
MHQSGRRTRRGLSEGTGEPPESSIKKRTSPTGSSRALGRDAKSLKAKGTNSRKGRPHKEATEPGLTTRAHDAEQQDSPASNCASVEPCTSSGACARILAQPTREHATTNTTGGDDGEESDPEDEETPWTCTLHLATPLTTHQEINASCIYPNIGIT